MITIATADGATAQHAYANAYDADHRMEGVRVEIAINKEGDVTARVYPGDEPATTKWPQADVDQMLVRMAELALEGDIDIYDDREVPAWVMVN